MLFTVYLDVNQEIALVKKTPRAATPGMVSEYKDKVCWVSGIFQADNPDQLLISRGAKRPCVYFEYLSEYATYDTDSEGHVDKTWHTSEEIKKLGPIPLTVRNTEFYIRSDNPRVQGGLEKTLDKQEIRNHIEYRYSEYIIPDNSSVWVLGIPGTDTIGPTEIGIIITMNTPDEYISEQGTTAIVLIVIVVVLLCVAGLFLGLGIRMIRK